MVDSLRIITLTLALSTVALVTNGNAQGRIVPRPAPPAAEPTPAEASTVEVEPVAEPQVAHPDVVEPDASDGEVMENDRAELPIAEPVPSTGQCMICVPNLEGRWSGYWESDESGHSGPLRARVEKVDRCHYRVVFCGRFWKVVPFRYGSELAVTGKGHGVVCLGGSERLGPVMGTFSYNARATQNRIVLCYQSRKDQGRFVMCRTE